MDYKKRYLISIFHILFFFLVLRNVACGREVCIAIMLFMICSSKKHLLLNTFTDNASLYHLIDHKAVKLRFCYLWKVFLNLNNSPPLSDIMGIVLGFFFQCHLVLGKSSMSRYPGHFQTSRMNLIGHSRCVIVFTSTPM